MIRHARCLLQKVCERFLCPCLVNFAQRAAASECCVLVLCIWMVHFHACVLQEKVVRDRSHHLACTSTASGRRRVSLEGAWTCLLVLIARERVRRERAREREATAACAEIAGRCSVSVTFQAGSAMLGPSVFAKLPASGVQHRCPRAFSSLLDSPAERLPGPLFGALKHRPCLERMGVLTASSARQRAHTKQAAVEPLTVLLESGGRAGKS